LWRKNELFGLKELTKKIIEAAGQLGLTGGAQLIFFPKSTKTSKQLLLEPQQHNKYAQTTPLDDGVSGKSSLFLLKYFHTKFYD
jgi:hypothetical protein